MRVRRWYYTLPLRMRSLFRRGRVEAELDEELRYHLERQIEENLTQGMTAEEARAAARRALGGVEQRKEECRDMRRVNFIEDFFKDLHYAIRILLKHPGFSLVAILTLGLGIGATTAIFSVVNAVLLRQLPVNRPEQVVIIYNQLPAINLPRTQVSALQYLDYSQADAFDSTAALVMRNLNLTDVGTPERLKAGRATASFFPLLGINPIVGHLYTAEEDKFGAPHVTLLGFSLWKRLFNMDPGVLGRTLQFDGESYEVIGVMPAAIEELYPDVDIWIPMAFTPRDLSEERRWSLTFTMLGRLKSGVNLQQAQSIMSGVSRNVSGEHPDDFNIEPRPIVEERVSEVRKPLYVLLCAVVVVLLISCANIANLLLARASVRSREIAIRAALGAGRRRILQQLLTESAVIGVVGGALGMALAAWGTKALIALAPADLPRISEIRLDVKVLCVTLAVSLASGILCGLIPALVVSRTDLAGTLKESGRSDTASRPRHRLRKILVIAEVSLAFVLLISTGLLLRSFVKLLDVSPGFDFHNVLTLRISLPRNQYGDAAQIAGFFNRALERISATPGVIHAAAAFQPPFTPGGDDSVFSIRDRQAAPGDPPPHADYLFVTQDYFQAIGIPLLKGRCFQLSDMRIEGPLGPGSAIIIDEALAKRYWPNQDPLGAAIGWGPPSWGTIVGIVGTVHTKELIDEQKGTIYFPWYFPSSTLVIRTTGDPRSMIPAIREQIMALDAKQPVYDIQTMDERLAHSLDARRFTVTLLGIFAALALLLAAIGLYGVIAYLVTQRSHEIGIRVALGAGRADILKLVLREAVQLALFGVATGFVAAFAVTRLMSSLLFGVKVTDPLTFASICGILIAVALMASYIPARRALRVDPMVALRYE